jgi:hypothetical protein
LLFAPPIRFRTHQILSLINWARIERGTEISIGSLMCAFNCSRSAVHSALPNGLSPLKSRGCHLAVDGESDTNILARIKKQAKKIQQQHAPISRIIATKYAGLKSRGDRWTRSSYVVPRN